MSELQQSFRGLVVRPRNFDGANHNRLMSRLVLKVGDKRVLKLIRKYLECGVIVDRLDAQSWNTLIEATAELERRFERRFDYKTVWTWAKICAGVLRVPRPVHEQRDPAKAEAFKRRFLGIHKSLPLQADKPVKVWFADESRDGLLPNLQLVWTKKGHRPHRRWKSEYKWSYCYGAIDVIDGNTVFVQTPTVNLDWTEAFLLQIKGRYPEHEHIVVWDGAGFHPKDSYHEQVPAGVHIVMLPPYNPELNPIERLWDLIQDHTSNKLWPTIETPDQVVVASRERLVGRAGTGHSVWSATDGYALQQTFHEVTTIPKLNRYQY